MQTENTQNSPAYLEFLLRRNRDLLDEISSSKQERSAAIDIAEQFSLKAARLERINQALQAENEVLKEQLALYQERINLQIEPLPFLE